MVTDEEVQLADDDADVAQAHAGEVREQAIDEHREAANAEQTKAEELE